MTHKAPESMACDAVRVICYTFINDFGCPNSYRLEQREGYAMTPELEAELRSTVASLRVKTTCQELLILALLPELQDHQTRAIRDRLADMENAEVVASRLVVRRGSRAKPYAG